MPQHNFVVGLSNRSFQLGERVDVDSQPSCNLEQEDFVWSRTHLDHHRCMVKLAITIGTCDSRLDELALEQQDIESISLLQELLL